MSARATRLAAAWAFAALLGIPAAARGEAGFVESEVAPVTPQIIAEHESIQPGGKTRIGVLFELEEGWHIYAKVPGDAGLPTKVRWVLPRGVTAGQLSWPAPQEFVDPGEIKTFGYSGEVVLASELRLGARAKLDKPVPVQAQVEWLACKDICIPGKTELQLTLPVSDEYPKLSSHANFFDHTG
jgi:DsbC/DsbD-like thiol-disulfide interchange protein